MSNHINCPRCNGRLLSGAKHCLSCGALVAPGRSNRTETSIGGARLILAILVVVFILTIGTLFLFAAVSGGQTGNGGSIPFIVDPITKCVPENSRHAIEELRSKGWTEVDRKPRMRCFQ